MGLRSSGAMRRVAIVVGIWTLVGLVSASQVWLASQSMGHAASFGAVVLWTVPVWLAWALLTPVVIGLARRFPLERGRLGASLPVHILAAVVLALIHLAWWLAWTQWVSPYALAERSVAEMMWLYVQSRFNVSFLLYWAVIGTWYATAYSRRWRQSELEASRLEARLAQVQLDALRAQVHPHFLFNTLHAISSLVARDPEGARHMLARLGDMLRLTLEREAVQEIPLRDELEYVEVYLDIEQTRFGDRLRVDFDVDPSVLNARVPNLILQPLVENAIRHGIARLEGPGRLGLSVRGDDGVLSFRIENDAPPGALESPRSGGLGLRNARDRLERLYGDGQRLDLQRRKDGGVVATLEVPFRETAQ